MSFEAHLPLVRQLRDEVTDARVFWEASFAATTGRAPSDEECEVWGEQAIVDRLTALERARTIAGEPELFDQLEDWLVAQVRSRVFGLGALDELLSNPRIENIVANGFDQVTVTEVGGIRRAGPPLADSEQDLEDKIRRLAATAGRTERRFDDAQPFLDLRLPDGSRLHAVKGVTERLCVSIRRHRFLQVSLADLVGLGTIDTGLAHVLACAARPPLPLNIVIVGGTDSGKTTFLRALVSEIPVDERLIVIEDNAELQLSADPARARHVVEMETRQPNVEGAGAIQIAELVRQSLRMRPDRVIVGEIRGGEAAEMFKAMSTGNDGSLSTLHADSSLSALSEMKLYGLMADEPLTMEASAQLIAESIHLVVHLRKLQDGTRVVDSIREITSAEGTAVSTNEVYAPGVDGRAQPTQVGFTDRVLHRLIASGFDPGVLLRPARYAIDEGAA